MTYEDPSTWRLRTTPGNVPYRIVGMEGSFEPERADATMEVLVASADLLSFADEMFPAPYLFGGFPVYPARGRITGTPLKCQKFTWKAHVDGKPVDPFNIDETAPSGTYQSVCSVSINFSTDGNTGDNQDQDESVPNDPSTFLEVSCSGAGEFIHSTAPKAVWVDDYDEEGYWVGTTNKLSTTPVSILVPEVEWDIRWPRIPYQYYTDTLVSRIRSCLGKVNSSAMTALFNAPKETILFVGYSMQKNYTWRTNTQPPFTLNIKFTEKHVVDDAGTIRGHNDFWKADVGWQRLLYDGVNPMYRSTDLNNMFKP